MIYLVAVLLVVIVFSVLVAVFVASDALGRKKAKEMEDLGVAQRRAIADAYIEQHRKDRWRVLGGGDHD